VAVYIQTPIVVLDPMWTVSLNDKLYGVYQILICHWIQNLRFT